MIKSDEFGTGIDGMSQALLALCIEKTSLYGILCRIYGKSEADDD